MSTANLDVIHAYRHLYRGLLRAVMHAQPARFTARDQIRAAFREPGGKLDPEAVKRTVWFFQAAARERGLEHRIVKNLILVRALKLSAQGGFKNQWHAAYHQGKITTKYEDYREAAFGHYDMTIAMLNQSMGLCLR